LSPRHGQRPCKFTLDLRIAHAHNPVDEDRDRTAISDTRPPQVRQRGHLKPHRREIDQDRILARCRRHCTHQGRLLTKLMWPSSTAFCDCLDSVVDSRTYKLKANPSCLAKATKSRNWF